jgi:hypothetical protein
MISELLAAGTPFDNQAHQDRSADGENGRRDGGSVDGNNNCWVFEIGYIL